MLEGFTPFPIELQKEYVKKGYWQEIPIGESFDRVVADFPKREALVKGNLRLTYEELQQKVNSLAFKLLESGLKPKDRVVLQLGNSPEFVYTYFALLKVGVIPVMCLVAHRQHEIEYIAKYVDAKGYIIEGNPELLELGLEIKKSVNSIEYVFANCNIKEGEIISLTELLGTPVDQATAEGYLQQFKPDPYEVAVFQLSGGTTGMPKIIPRTHNDYLYNSIKSGAYCGFNLYTAYLATTPLAHNFALANPGMQSVIMVGGKIVIPSSNTPQDIFATVEKEKVTFIPAVPAMIVNWVNSPVVKDYDLSSWEVVINGGAKLNPEVARRVKPILGCRLQQVLGMGEGLITVTALDDPDEIVFETVGRPISPADEIKIVDDDGNELPMGEVGELICRGPYTIRGYYKAEEHNKTAFTKDGYYKTGDMVRIQQDGCLIVEGRKKDLINRGGEKISAEEIENLILAHPLVKNVAAVAMPDPVLGERTCAYVILKEELKFNLEDLKNFLLQKNIAKFKLPERLEVVNEFPLTSVGKVSKKALREDITAKLKLETP